uniref:polynucleotide adenylyltransferase n=1 Tax=Meloidogyne incognita TaxID=6306 RepID=A0A914KGV5_MELIC
MSANICIENPQATSLSFLIKQFFNVYKAWKWEAYPLMLVELVDANEEFENASKIVEPWSGTVSSQQRGTNEGNDGTQMSIITPGFPEQNTTFNVNEFTLKRIVIELKRGFTLIERYSHQETTKIWDLLIKELDWKTHYNYFILILCRAGEFERNGPLECRH